MSESVDGTRSAPRFGSAAQAALWQRLQAHPFEQPDQPGDFLRRLAHEQGWTLAQARSAIEEYRRFCFLAVTIGREMTPSADVDEVWHLHLTRSRDYWQRFCPEVLGCDLHHNPGSGDRDEALRHRSQYGDTLRAYARVFGMPAERWWPAQAQTFRPVGDFRRVDLRRHFLIPKPRLPGLGQLRAWVLGAGLLAMPMLAAALPNDPFDWPAKPFLALYAGLCIAALIASLVIRARGREAAPAQLFPEPDVWELAYLAGGAQRAADAAVAQLLGSEAARWEPSGNRIEPTGTMAVLDPPASEALRCLKADARTSVALPRIVRAMEPLREKLARRHLWLDRDTGRRLAWLSAVPPLAVAAFGAVRIYLAIGRDKPYLFLLIMAVIISLIGIGFALSRPGRTRAGDRYLKDSRQRHSVTLRAPANSQLAMAVALGGTAVLAGTMYAGYHQLRTPVGDSSSHGGSDSSSSDSSSDGGSSDSSGCGGCGGGGD